MYWLYIGESSSAAKTSLVRNLDLQKLRQKKQLKVEGIHTESLVPNCDQTIVGENHGYCSL